jgi:hypothetical protein
MEAHERQLTSVLVLRNASTKSRYDGAIMLD